MIAKSIRIRVAMVVTCGFGALCLMASSSDQGMVAVDRGENRYPRIIPLTGAPLGAIMVPRLPSNSIMDCHTFAIGSSNVVTQQPEVSFVSVCYKKNGECVDVREKSDVKKLMVTPFFSLAKDSASLGVCKVNSSVVSLIAKTLNRPADDLLGACIGDQSMAESFVRYLSQRVLTVDNGVHSFSGTKIPLQKMPLHMIASDKVFEQGLVNMVRETRIYKGTSIDKQKEDVFVVGALDGKNIEINLHFNDDTTPKTCGDSASEDVEFGICMMGKCSVSDSIEKCKAMLFRQTVSLHTKKSE